jgi:diguanylate cyclase (GGDEF)-like protein/PAS domain S-box-containing protein
MSEEFHRSLVESLPDGVYFVEPDRTIKYWNQGAQRIAGFTPEDMVGRRCFDNLLAHVDENGNSLCHSTCPLAASMQDGRPRDATIWLRHKEGFRRPVRVRTVAVRDGEGRIIGGAETFSDATAALMTAEELERARRDSMTDDLTGLPNRRMFDSALGGRLENLRRYGWPFGLLMVDIDGFKRVNDEHGHAAGDAVLAGIARTILGAVRAGDSVARWGGEEFAVLVQTADLDGLRDAAERIRLLVARSDPHYQGAVLPVTVSVGGALAGPTDTAHAIFARTDAALYAAKAGGRNRTEIGA